MKRRRVAILALLLLGAAAFVSLWRLRPAVDSQDTPVSLANLKRHVAAIAVEPHPVDSPANRRVRDYILAELRSLGLDAQVQRATTSPESGEPLTLENIVCRIPGSPSGAESPSAKLGALLVCHYDSHPRAPGAGDDGAAVASLLEAARLLVDGEPPVRDIVLLFTDGEEYGLLGAQAWVSANPDLMNCRVLANFEARGSSGPAIMFETAGAPRDLFHNGYARRTPHPVTSSLASPVYERLPNGTDFTIFKLAGMSGLNFAFIGGLENYHTPRDDPQHLSDASLLHQAAQMFEIAQYFATAHPDQFQQNLSGEELGLVYVDVLSLIVIAYPAWLAWQLSVLAAIIAGAGAFRLRPRAGSIGPVLIRWLASLVILAGVLHLVSWLPTTSLTHRWTFLAFAGAAAAAVAALPFSIPRGRRQQRTGVMLGLLILMVGSLFTGFFFTPGHYAFLIPALAMGTATCLPVRSRQAAFALAAAICTIILLPLAWLVTVAMSIHLLAAPAVMLAMLAWLWQPALSPLLDARWTIAATGTAIASLCFAVVYLA